MARFVATWAISMKLGVMIPLGNMSRCFVFLFIFTIWHILWPPGGHLENQKTNGLVGMTKCLL
jgi:hypothetical protein